MPQAKPSTACVRTHRHLLCPKTRQCIDGWGMPDNLRQLTVGSTTSILSMLDVAYLEIEEAHETGKY